MDVAIWKRTSGNLIGHAFSSRRRCLVHLAGRRRDCPASPRRAAYQGDATIPSYAASKAGLHALIRHVARRWGKNNVRCNGVAPGLVLTGPARAAFTPEELEKNLEHLPLPRHGEPADLAAAVTFLLSEDSAWITGQVVSVNGGFAFRD